MQNNRYYKANELENLIFFQVPHALFTNAKYKTLQPGAKMLWGILYDRNLLSRQNRWIDDNGNVYIKFTREHMANYMGVNEKTARKYVKELVDHELLIDVRKGLTKSNVMYVLKPQAAENEKYRIKIDSNEVDKTITIKEVDLNGQKFQSEVDKKSTSKPEKRSDQKRKKSPTNKTDLIKIKLNKTNSQSVPEKTDGRTEDENLTYKKIMNAIKEEYGEEVAEFINNNDKLKNCKATGGQPLQKYARKTALEVAEYLEVNPREINNSNINRNSNWNLIQEIMEKTNR